MQERLGLREQYRVHIRQQILDLARPIVAEGGETALTMTEMAKLLDISIGSIYRYFPSRLALLAAIWQERIRALADAVDADHTDAEAGANEALRHLALSWTTYAGDDPEAVMKLAELLETAAGGEELDAADADTAKLAGSLVDAVAAVFEPLHERPEVATWRAASLLRVIAAMAAPFPSGERDPTLAKRSVIALIAAWTSTS